MPGRRNGRPAEKRRALGKRRWQLAR